MTIHQAVREHMAATGESMRALSLRAGLDEKAVTTLLHRPDVDLRQASLAALAAAVGASPSLAAEARRPATYRELMDRLRLESEGSLDPAAAKRAATAVTRLAWLLRKAGWVADVEPVDRRKVATFFAKNRPSTFGLAPTSYATYKSDVFAAIGRAPRARSALDLEGPLAHAQKAVRDSDLPMDLKLNFGSFLVWLADHGLAPGEITRDTLMAYHVHRLAVAGTTEKRTRKHIKTVARALGRMASHPTLAGFGFRAPGHPYADARDKYEVETATLRSLLTEFDARVGPWSRGEVSADGLARADFIAALDAKARPAPAEGTKKDLLRARERKGDQDGRAVERPGWEIELEEAGFLLPDERWSASTLRCRRGYVVAGAKALMADTGYLVESLEELTDPEVVDAMAEALATATKGEYSSGYIEALLKALRKIARGLVRRPAADLARLDALVASHKLDRDGLAPRNIAKLQAFTRDRQQRLIDLGPTLLAEIVAEIATRKRRLRAEAKRQARRAKGPRSGRRAGSGAGSVGGAAEGTAAGATAAPSAGPTGKRGVWDGELAAQVMVVLAQDILMSRAPRSANVLWIELSWIRWRDGQATIVVPSVRVKGRNDDDPDLPIALEPGPSALLRLYLDEARPAALMPGDERNPYLFPGQDPRGGRPGRPYVSLLGRLCREVHRVVGAPVHPHLYRHLIGWIWLRDVPTALPLVSKLLGHKSIETTARYYAQLDEELAQTHWQEYLHERTSKPRGGPRASRVPRA